MSGIPPGSFAWRLRLIRIQTARKRSTVHRWPSTAVGI